MGGVFSRLAQPVSKTANDEWLESLTPVKGEFRALMIGIAVGAIFHESKFGLAWERRNIMVPVQRYFNSKSFETAMTVLGMFADELIVPYFAALYWCLDKYKCVYGIWLVPVSEITNGCLKWYFRVPRPGWVDSSVAISSWTHEYSFPSSHSQIIWALATFFSGTSLGVLRTRLYGSLGNTALAYWFYLLGPYLFAACVSFSRFHSGVHYPRDVTVGAGIGVGLAALHMRFLPVMESFLRAMPFQTRFISLQILPAAFFVVMRWWHQHALHINYLPQDWVTTAARGAHAGKTLDPFGVPFTSYLGQCGVLSGLGIGVCLLNQVPLPLPTSFVQGGLRMLVGLTGLMVPFLGGSAIEKSAALKGRPLLIGCLRFLRFQFVPIHILVYAPAVFNWYEKRLLIDCTTIHSLHTLYRYEKRLGWQPTQAGPADGEIVPST
jgi:membrane-associated phospholipid phosphatase